jgi:hypothetical protein
VSDRKSITVSNHPAFVPNSVPLAPALQFSNGGKPPTLGEVLFLPLNDLAKIPTPFLNLLCATMLPDTQDLSIPQCMKTFFEWTQIVRHETRTAVVEVQTRPRRL